MESLLVNCEERAVRDLCRAGDDSLRIGNVETLSEDEIKQVLKYFFNGEYATEVCKNCGWYVTPIPDGGSIEIEFVSECEHCLKS